MMKKSSRFLIHLLPVAIFLTLMFSPGPLCLPKKNFLWKVQSKTNTVYLLGSIHFFKKEMYPLHERIESAFEQSQILVVEANIGEAGRADIQKVFRSAFYPENDALEKHLTPETYDRVKKEGARLGVPPELASRQKPWFLAMTLVTLELLKLGFDPKDGIDKYFLSKAAGKKKILELESIDYQIDLFSRLSDKEQELYLLFTLKDLRIVEQEVNKLVETWASGDATTMESIIMRKLVQDPSLSIIYKTFLFERNKKMATKIEGYLKKKETHLVIVGAGHLVGSQGILELLRGKGFPIEQL